MVTSLEKMTHFIGWTWDQIEPYYRDLQGRPLTAETVESWLGRWSWVGERIQETYERLYVATTVATGDQEAERQFYTFLEEIQPQRKAADQALKRKLLGSGLETSGMEIPLRKMRAEVEIFRDENLPLLTEEEKLCNHYDKIVGAQTVTWQGEETTLPQLKAAWEDPDRAVRERAWRMYMNRWLDDRTAINDLWGKLLPLRLTLAANAEMPDYRAYRWREMTRLSYTPDDCRRFHRSIEEVVVPAAQRIFERRRRLLGVETLRPWDLLVVPGGHLALRPFQDVSELEARTATIFQRISPKLGEHWETMQKEGLLDLDNRKDKAPGGYCVALSAAKRPFIFMNAVGIHEDVMTALHEGGHAFHVFESASLPFHLQKDPPMEFAEVASTAMEFLGSLYLQAREGGFYPPEEAARARVKHLEESLTFWTYMAVVDAFQHWVYENPGEAVHPEACDAQWAALWDRFRVGVDWTGLETEKATGWHRKLHIHQLPFYYIEYGLAQLGAVQVWRRALENPAEALGNYRRALALGGTASLPGLFQAAGARLAFNAETLGEAVALMETTIAELDAG
jgi:oligoendopeptidase F